MMLADLYDGADAQMQRKHLASPVAGKRHLARPAGLGQ
jgi:hypothetical protein